jgi:hypothetical protein
MKDIRSIRWTDLQADKVSQLTAEDMVLLQGTSIIA